VGDVFSVSLRLFSGFYGGSLSGVNANAEELDCEIAQASIWSTPQGCEYSPHGYVIGSRGRNLALYTPIGA